MLSPDAVVVLFVVALELFADLLCLVDVEVNVARGVVQPVCNFRHAQPVVLLEHNALSELRILRSDGFYCFGYVDGTTEVGWVDVEHTVRAKDTPRPVVFRDSALRKQIASALGWETFNADRMFETLSGICVNVDMVTLHFKNGGTKQFQYIQPKQIHRKRKETT